jgi:hypothetical protein
MDSGISPVDAGPPPVDAGPPLLPGVSGLEGYSIVYRMQIPVSGARFNSTGAPWAEDNSAALAGSFTRVGWYVELQDAIGPRQFIYVEGDAPTSEISQVGVPTTITGAVFQEDLANARVVSNHPGVTSGSGLPINLEFWASDYSENNDVVPSSPTNADDGAFDFGDSAGSSSDGHGSMQIHNFGEGRTLFGFSDWGGNAPDDPLALGLGTNTSGHPDWTFVQNADDWIVKNLVVVVDALPDLSQQIDGSVPGPPNAVSSVVDANELVDYRLVYDLDVPETAAYNPNGVPYTADHSALVPAGSFDRIAYFMELRDGSGGIDWVWVSMAAFTLDATRIGVPASGTGAHFQHVLKDGHVQSNVVMEGDALTGLNMEFWSTNYQTNDALPVGASGGVFDHGDRPSDGQYGSMQIHNGDVPETLFAYNHWGNAAGTQSDVGIGNSPTGNTDWTFEGNSATWTSRRLLVLVRARP